MKDKRARPAGAWLGCTLATAGLLLSAGPVVSQAAGAVPREAPSEEVSPASRGAFPLLDVPFIPQTPDLCGGAAVAMVVRYWGGGGISADDFAHLVSDEARGIPTGELRRASEELGWRAFPFRGDASEIRGHLERGRPLIALLRVGPERYHYVVLVGWLGERVVLHDPARGPYLAPRIEELREAWEPADQWAMLLLPEAEPTAKTDPDPPREGLDSVDSSPCASLVARGVRLGRDGALAEADAAFESAGAACPREAAAFRERAGLRLRAGRPAEAAELSERALALDPHDPHAARTLAAARYLAGESRGALAAWNRVGGLQVDLVQTEGTRRVPPPAVVRMVGLRPGQRLTPETWGRAERRLAHLPAAQATRLAYHPLPDGSARVVAAIHESPSLPTSTAQLLVTALRTAAHREAIIHAASPLRAGELWSARGRFESGRPGASLQLAAPAGWPAPGGVWRVQLGWERQTYGRPGLEDAGFADADRSVAVEERRGGTVELSRWEAHWIRWRLGLGLDRWEEPGSHLALSGGLATRLFDDRLSLSGSGGRWIALASNSPFSRANAAASWRSRVERRGLVWSVDGGAELVTPGSPLGLWPGAGEGRAREPYLRGHPLLRHGEVAGPAFGRSLVHGGTEFAAWTVPGGRVPAPARLGLAAFLDVARWGRKLPREPQGVFHADAGLGLRFAPGADGGTLRLDVARGLRDGGVAVTAGWEAAWPRLER